MRVVRDITGAPSVNTVSVCLGGTLTALGLAYNAARGDDSIKSATFLNTHTDFTEPGLLGVFTDEATVAQLEKQMQKQGFLDSATMARTFSALRSNDLIFQYVVEQLAVRKQAAVVRSAGVERRLDSHAGPDAFGVSALVLSAQRIRAR